MNLEILPLNPDYQEFLESLKDRVSIAQLRAVASVNRELVLLNWQIGKEILKRQEQFGWGARVIDLLSRDLTQAFPNMRGFSPRNLKYMRAFAQQNPADKIVQEVLAQLTWYHNITLLDKVKEGQERLWYAQNAIEYGWSRNMLVHQIELKLYERQGKALSNFQQTLISPQSDLAQQSLKDPYIFDFLMLTSKAQEREIEKALVQHITKFLLELGSGFAFIGQQYHLEVEGKDYYADLLFYNLKLRCYVVIELKTGEFKPEYAGKLNFYLSALDKFVKDAEDKPSIGMILCKSKGKLIVELALKDINKPIGVANYELLETIPEKFKASLPSVEELEAEYKKAEVEAAKKAEI